MVDDLVAVYDGHFSESEITGILAFQNSPIGQKLTNFRTAVGQTLEQRLAEEGAAFSESFRQLQSLLIAEIELYYDRKNETAEEN